MKFHIVKNKLSFKLPEISGLQNIKKFTNIPMINPKTDFDNISKTNLEKLDLQTVPDEIADIDETIPKFISVTKLDFDGAEIHGGIIKDSLSKSGLKYVVIQPRLSVRDKQNFDLIKKLLMTELNVSLSEIRTKKDAERRLKRKIIQLIKKYKLEIKTKNLSKISYYAIRDFIYSGKIEPLMRDHMVEEISCDGTNIPLYIWHREYESIPTNVIFQQIKNSIILQERFRMFVESMFRWQTQSLMRLYLMEVELI